MENKQQRRKELLLQLQDAKNAGKNYLIVWKSEKSRQEIKTNFEWEKLEVLVDSDKVAITKSKERICLIFAVQSTVKNVERQIIFVSNCMEMKMIGPIQLV